MEHERLESREIRIILAVFAGRTILAALLGTLVAVCLRWLIIELQGGDPNAALTALLGAIVGYIGASLQQIVGAIAADVLGYLKDRLGTRGKAEDT